MSETPPPISAEIKLSQELYPQHRIPPKAELGATKKDRMFRLLRIPIANAEVQTTQESNLANQVMNRISNEYSPNQNFSPQLFQSIADAVSSGQYDVLKKSNLRLSYIPDPDLSPKDNKQYRDNLKQISELPIIQNLIDNVSAVTSAPVNLTIVRLPTNQVDGASAINTLRYLPDGTIQLVVAMDQNSPMSWHALLNELTEITNSIVQSREIISSREYQELNQILTLTILEAEDRVEEAYTNQFHLRNDPKTNFSLVSAELNYLSPLELANKLNDIAKKDLGYGNYPTTPNTPQAQVRLKVAQQSQFSNLQKYLPAFQKILLTYQDGKPLFTPK